MWTTRCRWTTDFEYESDAWTFVHSAAPKRFRTTLPVHSAGAHSYAAGTMHVPIVN